LRASPIFFLGGADFKYKIINSGTAPHGRADERQRAVALVNSVETVSLEAGFSHVARAADDLEMPQSGLGLSIGSIH
jgi:hypothetical protein